MKFCPECGHKLDENPRGFVSRRFTFSDYWTNSNKFWEIWLHNLSVFTRYGRLGTKGTLVVKEFDSAREARAYREEKIREKLNKGYVEA